MSLQDHIPDQETEDIKPDASVSGYARVRFEVTMVFPFESVRYADFDDSKEMAEMIYRILTDSEYDDLDIRNVGDIEFIEIEEETP